MKNNTNFFADQQVWPFWYALGTLFLFCSIPFLNAICFTASSNILGQQFHLLRLCLFFIGQMTLIFLLRGDTFLKYNLRFVVLGYALAAGHYFCTTHPVLQQSLPPLTFTAEIEQIEKTGALSVLTCRVKGDPDVLIKKILVLIQGGTIKTLGESFTLTTALHVLQTPFPNVYKQTQYRLQGVQAQTPVLSDFSIQTVPKQHYSSVLNDSRSYIRQRIERALGAANADSVALVNALVLGDTTAISKTTKRNFAYSGLSHLLAISGLHMTLVIGLLYGILRLLGAWIGLFWQRYSLRKLFMPFALLGGGGYLLLSGANPPALRAYGMVCVVALGLGLNKPITPRQRLLSTVGFLLLINPFFILMPSFQLSFMAVWGLVNLAPSNSNKIIQSLRVTIRATVATLPLCIYYFDQIPLSSIPANLLAVPLTSFIIIPLIGLSLILPSLGGALNGALNFLQTISSVFATEVGTVQTPYLPLWLILLLVVIVGMGCTVKGKQQGILACLALCMGVICLPAPKMVVVKDQSGQLYPAMVQTSGILWVRDLRAPAIIAQLLKYAQCTKAVVTQDVPWENLEKSCPEGCFLARFADSLSKR